MTKRSVIWSLVAAVIVGAAALLTGYIYMERAEKSAEAPVRVDQGEAKVTTAEPEASEPAAATPDAADEGSEKADGADLKAARDSLSFDVVGVEPTGETVVAGRSEAGAIIALTANGEVIGKGIANDKGEWTIILDKPLQPGDYDVGLQVMDAAGNKTHESTERLAVSVPEDGKSKPLVVLNKPEAPSDILQMPAPVETAEAEEETVVAAASGTAPAAEAQAPAETETAATELEAGQEPAATAPQDGAEAPAAKDGDVAAVETGQPVAPITFTAKKEDAVSGALTVTVEAVESEDGMVFVAGTGETGRKVRIYIGDEFVGEAQIGANGRWLVEGDKSLAAGEVEVRADMVGDAKGTVVARSAVTFEKTEEQVVLTKVIASGESAVDSGVSGASVSKPLPNVIIRKGDNLWNISRRLYGKGVRYTTIYQANKSQIRNPDLIYPGQVFLTPESDLNWKPEAN